MGLENAFIVQVQEDWLEECGRLIEKIKYKENYEINREHYFWIRDIFIINSYNYRLYKNSQ